MNTPSTTPLTFGTYTETTTSEEPMPAPKMKIDDEGIEYETIQAATRPEVAKADLNLPNYSTTVGPADPDIIASMQTTITDLEDMIKRITKDGEKHLGLSKTAFHLQTNTDTDLLVARATIKQLRDQPLQSPPELARTRYPDAEPENAPKPAESTAGDGDTPKDMYQIYEMQVPTQDPGDAPIPFPHTSEHTLDILYKLAELVAARDNQLSSAKTRIEALIKGEDNTELPIQKIIRRLSNLSKSQPRHFVGVNGLRRTRPQTKIAPLQYKQNSTSGTNRKSASTSQ